jgi:hypothetical protein
MGLVASLRGNRKIYNLDIIGLDPEEARTAYMGFAFFLMS